jgi:hypothetical protein
MSLTDYNYPNEGNGEGSLKVAVQGPNLMAHPLIHTYIPMKWNHLEADNRSTGLKITLLLKNLQVPQPT